MAKNQTSVRLYWLSFFLGHVIVVPVLVPLFKERGADLSDVLIVQAVYSVCVIVSEIPSGIFADHVGRRAALIVGCVLWFSGHLVLISSFGMPSLVVYRALVGLGTGMVSGADVALLYESELGSSQADRQRSLGLLQTARSVSEVLAALVAATLAIWSLELVVVVQAVIALVPLLISFGLVESVRTKARLPSPEGLRIVASNPLGRSIGIVMILLGTLTSLSLWLIQGYWSEAGVSSSALALLWACFNLWVAVASRFASTVQTRYGWRRVLLVGALSPAVGFLGMTISEVLVGTLFGLVVQTSRAFQVVQLREAFNSQFDNSHRALVNSALNLGTRACMVFALIGGGILLKVAGLRGSIFAVGVLALVAGALSIRALSRLELTGAPAPDLAG